ncbi:MAG: uncharacterized protein KVP18_004974 [Porospora cf. gigantea A]|uniref:uncharacterized protein n=1 Tax=Porospora cf. gigantea A TaxID=2853593 RepID=UPI003559D7AB|nr:MAG: hypothetical protein KVP18_004974 [Porospora cf. gigantea A]
MAVSGQAARNPEFEVPSVGVPCLLLTAMHHAREPLSLTTATQLLFQNFVSDKALRKSRCVAFIPFVNPDGYAFICQTGFLMARKNRRPTCEAATHSGVDLNRNYGFHWAHQYPKCSLDEYEGSGAFSEPESRAIRRVARNMKTVVSALNFHSFGKGEWAIPYNCCADLSIPRWARVVVDDLKSVEGMNPLHSAPSNPALGYTTSGEADDYLLNEFNILSASPEVGKEFWPADATRAIQAATEENQVGFREWLRITGPRLRVKWVGDSTVELTNTLVCRL